ncbi:MAG: histidine triad nucleotide-binding protein [Candidatus Marinimicrobia bacterium]|jgi:histidine triad (HIT) family protein|nr:histidine triad nucleotide-binding protein [Candidatus Neomarinimicrobiota bacterium]MBT7525223.1 histidine triad nucleotide-binding protein [Candidatus Neomarinimicrobiota bacterium]
MDNCLFCKIINGEITATKIYENEHIIAFNDIDPKAPIHILVIPKKHIRSINELNSSDINLAGEIILAAKKIAKDQGVDSKGFRVVFNTNDDGGQTVYHIHMHIMGGRQMQWPPG